VDWRESSLRSYDSGPFHALNGKSSGERSSTDNKEWFLLLDDELLLVIVGVLLTSGISFRAAHSSTSQLFSFTTPLPVRLFAGLSLRRKPEDRSQTSGVDKRFNHWPF